MIRHLIPRCAYESWHGDALTTNPNAGREIPDSWKRDVREAFDHPTIMREPDEIRGGTLTIQWLGLIAELCIGRVDNGQP